MGAASSYATLKVGQVILGSEIDEQHATLPAVLVVGEQATINYSTADNRLTVEYPYLLVVLHKVAVADMTSPASHTIAYTTLKANLQELERRLRIMIKTRGPTFGGLASSDGEKVNDVEFGIPDLGHGLLSIDGPVEGSYRGAAYMPFTVKAMTT